MSRRTQDNARKLLGSDVAFLDLDYPAQLLIALLALDGGWGEASPSALVHRYAGGHVRARDEMVAECAALVERGLLCLYTVGGCAAMHLVRGAHGPRPAALPPCPAHPDAAGALSATPHTRRRPAQVPPGAYQDYCAAQIALLGAQLPDDPLIRAWREAVCAARPPGARLGAEMADLAALADLVRGGQDWRRGLQKALERGVTSITYVEKVAQDAPAPAPSSRPLAPPARAVRRLETDDPVVCEERRLLALRAEEARRYSAALRSAEGARGG